MVEQTEKIPLAGSLLCLILCNVQKLGCVCARQCRCRLLCALTNGNKHNMIRNETDMFGQSLYMFAVQAVKQTSKHTHAGWCSSLIHIISANRRIMSSLEYFQTERMSQLSEQHSERNKKRWLTSYIWMCSPHGKCVHLKALQTWKMNNDKNVKKQKLLCANFGSL